ncbi:UvrD-helicase domain-containing protein [Raoultella ornithinolytica]|uniref:UvrD-helicase domain-containing protein n=1 Tax=Raoultella ornithinolytica TaxID=54291 RepID=UPI00403DA9BC
MASSTEEQDRVIRNMDKNTMVIACPGSGKSFTMKEGTKSIFQRHPLARVSLVTFTRAATDSLKNSLQKMIEPKFMSRIEVDTFHGFIKKMVNQSGWNGGLLIGHKQMAMVSRVQKHLNYHEGVYDIMPFIDGIGRELNPDIIRIKYTREQVAFYNEYMNFCKKDNVADFNSLSKYVVGMLSADKMRPLSITHLIVDEVQDTDSIQFTWISEHAKRGINTTIVGDDDQTIYSFRDAGGVKIFRQFDKAYNPNVFHLTKCFRCAPLILKYADTVIRKNKARYEKSLVSGRKGDKGKVTFIRSANAEDQFDVIKELVERNPHDWAILSRNNTTLDKMESYLEMPVTRIGGKSFWEGLEPSNILHLFSFFRQPGNIGLMKRVLSFFNEDEQILDMVWKTMSTRKVTFQQIDLPHDVSVLTKTLHKHMVSMMTDTLIKEEIEDRFKKIKDWLGMAGYKMSNTKGDPSVTRISLMSCYRWAIKDGWLKMLNIAAGMTMGSKKETSETEQNGICLCTLHGSKGLEWKKVIIINCNHDQIPSLKVIGEEGIEEERRLFFVGMTRAELELYITWNGKPSEFITESFPKVVELSEENAVIEGNEDLCLQ